MKIKHYIRMVDPRYRYKSSVDGEYVTRMYALKNPRETYRERVK